MYKFIELKFIVISIGCIILSNANFAALDA
jgi:hypothetical protein